MDSKFYYTLAIRDIYGAEDDLFDERSLNIYDMFLRMRKHIMNLINNNLIVDFSMYTLIVIKRCAWKKHNYDGKKLGHKKQQIHQRWFPTRIDKIENFINELIFKKFCTFEILKKLKSVSDLIPTLNKFLTG